MKRVWHLLRKALQVLGPGLITGSSDDDPSGIGTYSTAGAGFGFATLWTALITFPLMAAVQVICARIGLVSGMGLAGVVRKHYARWLLYPIVCGLVIANTINAGADIGAIAAAINLLVPIPAVFFVIPTALALVGLQIWGSYRLITRIFKWLTLSLLAYIATAFFVKPDMLAVLKGTFVPTIQLNANFLSTLVAILGTTISPYLFFWQASSEVEDQESKQKHSILQRRGTTARQLRHAAWDVDIGMLFSNLVMYFIILTTAATLFKAGKTQVPSATDVALALRPLAGNGASILLALGLIGSGMLAVPILTGSSAYVMAEAFEWPGGLNKKPHQARRFYIVIALSTLLGMLINFFGFNPIAALFWTALINGLLAPPLMLVIMLIANNRKVMGDKTNGFWLNFLGWIATLLMSAAAIVFLLTAGQGS
ncbi:divalent metal cation transporter [Ktedonosporobacter rubrisoli]|uniref:Divalent metal cation transporter n=1 Tax=Ktedonosporobacter rubrisoli TaxID=2509675 RepID=A0A4P6JTM7_KTERU|nr:divalent metal cation transporter [Ktedonosporobacter rubrisoli]QBD78928.1 divalent metal cation transporter [Ktedonosporobacter rubrisoli]